MVDREDTMIRGMTILLLIILLLGCIERVERTPDGFDRAKIITACDQIIDDFQAALKQELATALARGGPENAIYVCNVVAPVIADSFSQMAGIDIRRVSLRQRNSQYTPDSFETAVLTKFKAAGTSEPQSYSRLVFDSANIKRLRYMKEIKLGQLCVKCHGDPGAFPASLKAALTQNYPNDRAVGYAVGDSRGAFSVTVSYPEARETITAILSEHGR